MKDLIIIGASGFGREVAWLVERINQVDPTWNLLGFLDDADEAQGRSVNGYEVLGKTDRATTFPDAHLVCAVGSARTRESIVSRVVADAPRARFSTLVDPGAEMSSLVSVGAGSIICAHTLVTTNVEIGDHVIVNLDCTIGHDAVVGDFVTLYPSVNVSGATALGRCCELGTGAQVIQGKTIGPNAIVGAGAVVVRDIPASCTAVGSPARPIKYFD